MATVDKATVSPVLATKFENELANAIQRAVPLLQLIRVKPAMGQNVSWTAVFGSGVGAAIADGAAASSPANDTRLPAVLQFAVYEDTFEVTGLARSVAQAAGNPRALADLFGAEMADSTMRLAKGIGAAIYTGTGGASPQSIHGLRSATVAAVGDSGVYAGIDRAAQTQWRSSVVDATTYGDLSGNSLQLLTAFSNIPLIIVAMRQLRTAIATASGEKPDLFVCSPAIHEKLGMAMHAERRWVDQVRTNGGVVKLDPGYMALEFDGTPVIEDPNCPAGIMMALNTQEMYIHQPPNIADAVSGGMAMSLYAKPSGLYGDGRTGLAGRLNPIARAGDAFKFQSLCYLQLQVRKPNCFGVITGLV